MYQQGHAIKVTTTMDDVMGMLGWAMVLPICKQPHDDLPCDACLQRLLVTLLQSRVEPLHACRRIGECPHSARRLLAAPGA